MVGGGSNNWANGPWSMIPGGRECLALGNGSFAAGLFAEARHDGTFVWSDSNLGFASTGNNQFLIRATGGVGIGTTTPLEALHVKGNGPTLAVEGSDHAYIEYYPDGAAAGRKGYMGWAGPGSTDFTIDNEMSGGSLRLWSATGRVGVLRAPTTNALEVSGNASKTTAGDWLANSDKAIKTGVRSITGALEVISRLRPVAFRYTDDYKTGHPSIKDQDYYNYIAQEFREVFPEWVQDSGEDGLLQMDAYPASVYSVAAIQELHELVQEKDCEIETLVSEFSNLKSQISEFQSEASEIANLKSEIAELKALVANLAPKNGGGQ